MKQVFKRFLSLALAMLMVLTLLPAMTTTAWATKSGTVTGLADENIGLSFTGDADNAWGPPSARRSSVRLGLRLGQAAAVAVTIALR